MNVQRRLVKFQATQQKECTQRYIHGLGRLECDKSRDDTNCVSYIWHAVITTLLIRQLISEKRKHTHIHKKRRNRKKERKLMSAKETYQTVGWNSLKVYVIWNEIHRVERSRPGILFSFFFSTPATLLLFVFVFNATLQCNYQTTQATWYNTVIA